MTRKQLFNTDDIKPRGVAIESIMPGSRVPVIEHNILPEGSCILQNLPSVICSHVLSPRPGETVIDMCAAPGNKTTHLAGIMQDKGIIVALDKTLDKVNTIKRQCEKWNLKCIHPFAYDATKAFIDLDEESGPIRDVMCGPPFHQETFDRVLLDAPCSALGQRPLLKLSLNQKCLKSFAVVQRKLFHSAVRLLKAGGALVYSTCTIRVEECEEMVSWALQTFPCLRLVPAHPLLGDPGWEHTTLTQEQRMMVQRFGPKTEDSVRETDPIYNINDTIGFFIAHFVKE